MTSLYIESHRPHAVLMSFNQISTFLFAQLKNTFISYFASFRTCYSNQNKVKIPQHGLQGGLEEAGGVGIFDSLDPILILLRLP